MGSWSHGGATFINPKMLTVPPTGTTKRWGIEYPTASTKIVGEDAGLGFWSLWRQTGYDLNNHPTGTTWKARYTSFVDTTWTMTNSQAAFTVPGLPATAGPSAIGSWIDGGVEHLFIVFPTADNLSGCPGTATIPDLQWRLLSADGPDFASFSNDLITEEFNWKKCVGESALAGGTAFNRQTVRPQFAIDPVTKTKYVAISNSAGIASGQTVIRVFQQPQGGVFSLIYTSKVTPPPPSTRKDSWSPSLAVHHYPGEPSGQVFLHYRTTWYDSGGNRYIRRAADMSLDSGANWAVSNANGTAGTPFVIDNSAPQIVDEYMGDYEGGDVLAHLGGPSQ